MSDAPASTAASEQQTSLIKKPPAASAEPEADVRSRNVEHASILSRWTFWWLNGLLSIGHSRPLQASDVADLPSAEQAHDNAQRFDEILHALYAHHLPDRKRAAAAAAATTKEDGSSAPSTPAAAAEQPPPLARAIYRLVGHTYLRALLYQVLAEILAFAGPVLVERITSYLQPESSEPYWRGWLYTALLFVLPTVASISRGQYYIQSWQVAVRLRGALLASVFRKSLRLSPAARRLVSDGQILTLISADAQKLAEIWVTLYVLFTSPLSILACFVLIWMQVGVSTLAGAAVIAVLMPLNILLGKVSGGYRKEEAAFTDQRLRYIKEAVSNMKVIRQYAWSDSFSERITHAREKEIAVRKRAAYLEALSNSILILTPVLISLATFLCFAALGNELTASNVFTSVALFNVMRFQLSQFPLVLTALFEARVCLRRLLNLLLREEIAEDARDYSPDLPPEKDAEVIRVEDATFSWDEAEHGTAPLIVGPSPSPSASPALPAVKGQTATTTQTHVARVPNAAGSDSNFRLSNVSLSVRRGELVAIVGAVGSGKSTLLQALLGEVARVSSAGPRVWLRGRVAIVPQSAWVLNMSLKDNILFGIPEDQERYQKVIELCCLQADLAQLPAGDQTQIGDRGVTLSGGQKQRVAIGRAVYAALSGACDMIFLDDPLSAVDAHVSKALFERVLSRSTGVLGQLGLTTLLAMNQLHFLPRVDRALVMKAGRVIQEGTYASIMQEAQGELATLMSGYGFAQEEHNEEKSAEQDATAEAAAAVETQGAKDQAADGAVTTVAGAPQPSSPAKVAAANGLASNTGPASTSLPVAPLVSATGNGTAAAAAAAAPTAAALEAGQTHKAETRKEGQVSWSVYAAYIRASGGWIVLVSIIVLFCVHQSGRVGADFWLSFWAEQDWDNPSRSLAEWMGIFGAFGAAVTVASLIRSLLFARQTLAAAFNLHQSMLFAIFASPASFFDTTPVGRVLNRFSGDVDKLDHMLGRILEGWGGCVFFVLGTVVAICIVFPFYILPLLVIIAIYTKVQQFYVASSRELQRLDNTSKSPIFSHFGEALQGAGSIRAFGAGGRFHRGLEGKVDENHRHVIAYQAALCWLAVRIEFISTLLMTVSAIFAVTSRGTVDPALVGLTIVYSITITSFLNLTVRLGSVVEALMSSVERLDEYSLLPNEGPQRLPTDPSSTEWPSQGAIEFDKLELKYRPELETVLKGVSARVEPGEKVGIIGRTGSGKSSLMVALFRLVDPSGGRILIDGVDITSIGLSTLRAAITLIPQEPVLFAGSVRYNLDPFGLASDERIWRALEHVNLANKIRQMDAGLDFQLSEGESLSVGERQLLCVCRALLRETKVLVLDEATASVDIESDNLLQSVLAREFKHATVLAIAHRLSTIMDYDKILVMDKGRVAEFGVPHELLQNPASALLSLVEATGPASAAYLKQVARSTYERRARGDDVLCGLSALQAPDAPGDNVAPSPHAKGDDEQRLRDASCVRFHMDDDDAL